MSASASFDRGLIAHGNSLGCLITSHVNILQPICTTDGEKETAKEIIKQKGRREKTEIKKGYSRRESGLINLLGNDLPSFLVQRGGNVKRSQDRRDRDPVCRATHEPPRADAPSVSERNVSRVQRCAPSGQIAFRDEAFWMWTYVCLVVQKSTGQNAAGGRRRCKQKSARCGGLRSIGYSPGIAYDESPRREEPALVPVVRSEPMGDSWCQRGKNNK